MLAFDCIGLVITALVVAPRYFHYVIAASVLQECGRTLMVLFLQGKLEGIVSAGVFGATTYSGLAAGYYPLILIGGWFLNYTACCLAGGINREPTAHLLRPMSKLVQPFAVVNLRFACLSMVISVIQWMVS